MTKLELHHDGEKYRKVWAASDELLDVFIRYETDADIALNALVLATARVIATFGDDTQKATAGACEGIERNVKMLINWSAGFVRRGAQRYLSAENSSLGSYKKMFLFACVPLLVVNTLIYEVQGIFLSFHIAITQSVYRHRLRSEPHGAKGIRPAVFIAGYLVVLVPFFASILAHGDKQQRTVMFNNIKDWAGANSDAIYFHSSSLSETMGLARIIIADPSSFLTWLPFYLVQLCCHC
jgi:hypothetical protein